MSYCDGDDIKARFGNDNVTTWADLDNDEDPAKIAARITASIVAADAEINDFLRGGMYTIPFEGTPPEVVKGISADLAAVWLYESRGVVDFDAETGRSSHRLKYVKDRALRKLRQISAGVLKLDLDLTDEIVPAVEEEAD